MGIGVTANTNKYTVIPAVKNQQQDRSAKDGSVNLSENRISLETFKELLTSEMTSEEKTEKIREAFGEAHVKRKNS